MAIQIKVFDHSGKEIKAVTTDKQSSDDIRTQMFEACANALGVLNVINMENVGQIMIAVVMPEPAKPKPVLKKTVPGGIKKK